MLPRRVPEVTATTTKQRIVLHAEKVLGRRQLATGLGATEAMVEGWITGKLGMPDAKLLTLAKMLEQHALEITNPGLKKIPEER